MIVRSGKFIVSFVGSDEVIKFDSLGSARTYAEEYVGNKSAARPFKDESTYLYGPGDGTTSLVVREDCDIQEAAKSLEEKLAIINAEPDESRRTPMYRKGERVVVERWNAKGLKTYRQIVCLERDCKEKVLINGRYWKIVEVTQVPHDSGLPLSQDET